MSLRAILFGTPKKKAKQKARKAPLGWGMKKTKKRR